MGMTMGARCSRCCELNIGGAEASGQGNGGSLDQAQTGMASATRVLSCVGEEEFQKDININSVASLLLHCLHYYGTVHVNSYIHKSSLLCTKDAYSLRFIWSHLFLLCHAEHTYTIYA